MITQLHIYKYLFKSISVILCHLTCWILFSITSLGIKQIGFAAGDMPDTQYSTTIKVLAGCLSGINILFIPGRILYPRFAHKKQERETKRNDLERIDEEE